jgi:hypothetical protein
MARYQLQISARMLNWPKQCACCCDISTTALRATATKTKGKKVVTSCAMHISVAQKASTMMATGIVIAVVAAIIALFEGSGTLALVVAILILAPTIWLSNRTKAQARAIVKARCGSVNVAVHYAGWYGTFHEFIFTNRSFVQLFVLANNRKTMSDIREMP